MKKTRLKHNESSVKNATIGRLLDTAERLFGEHGYDGVGMRTLADEAGVNLGAATYHFGSKKGLYMETFMRRFRPLNAERLQLLREAQQRARGRPIAVEVIVSCIVRPTYKLGMTHPQFDALLARNFSVPPPFLRAAMQKEFETNILEFINELRRALPKISENLIRLRVMFSVAPLLMFASKIGRTSAAGDINLHERLLKELVRFVAAGLKSPAAVDEPFSVWPPVSKPK